MKKIMIIDGGPRKRFNLAALYESFKEGVKAVSEEIEVKHVYLYDLNFKGCVSCMGCKIAGGKNVGRCLHKDELSEVIEETNTADGLAFGSPVYFMNISGELESALERIIYPWLSYKEGRSVNPNRVPTASFYTMNANPEQVKQYELDRIIFDRTDFVIASAWTMPERVLAHNTCQVKDYSKYDLQMFPAEMKHAWRDAHFAEDRQKAFDAGKHMAEKILAKQHE